MHTALTAEREVTALTVTVTAETRRVRGVTSLGRRENVFVLREALGLARFVR